MNETALLEQLLEKKRHIEKIHNINVDLNQHLLGSIIQLLRYGEKYNVIIPKKQQLEAILINTKLLLEEYNESVDQFDATETLHQKNQPQNGQSLKTITL